MLSAYQRSRGAARSVPAPISTASAQARKSPIRNRSGSEPPLTTPPDSPPASGSATTPSSDSTKFAATPAQRGLPPYAATGSPGTSSSNTSKRGSTIGFRRVDPDRGKLLPRHALGQFRRAADAGRLGRICRGHPRCSGRALRGGGQGGSGLPLRGSRPEKGGDRSG